MVVDLDLRDPTALGTNGKNVVKLIASYPRSGNHLCRFIVEYVTGRPTQGCLSNPSDVPIFENCFEAHPSILSHVRPGDFIAQKAHFWGEIKNCSNHFSIAFSGMLFICRDPINAVIGHFLVTKRERQLSDFLRQHYDLWEQLLIQSIRTTMPKKFVFYDDLIAEKPAPNIRAIQSIAELFWENLIPVRLFEMITRFDEMKQICATGTKRSWAGVRSVGHPPSFHFERLDENQRDFVKEYVRDRIAGTIDKLRQFAGVVADEPSTKLPSATPVIEQLVHWQRDIDEL